MTIGERIRSVRITKGLTQKQLAEKCGMADSAIRKYESGRVTPKHETIQRIASALNVGFLDLVEVTPIPGNAESARLAKQILEEAEAAKREGKIVVWRNNGLEVIELEPVQKLLIALEDLNDEGTRKLIAYADDLISSGKYQKATAPESSQ